jgi:tRNA A-37 threonylcarbamoyl transferase component Bud32
MASEKPNLCPECGKTVPAHSQHRVCPACLISQALASRTIGGEADDGPVPRALPAPEEIANKFPQFEIVECLGRGGMGVVYKARQKSLNRTVAIKILAPERVHDSRFAARFAREAELLAQLSHPHIVTIHDFGQADGLFYLLMEFVDGVNLRDLLREGKIESRQALKIVPSICEALQYAHEKGIVHRDIKPENLLLDRDGRVKIADFGIAGLVGAEGESAGTPPYMAPEQSDARREVDHRADIYALGVVLYEMLTGERPSKEVVAPSQKVLIDVRLDEVVLRALEKNPEHRYQQASVFKTQVETIANEPAAASGKTSEEVGRRAAADAEARSVAATIGGAPSRPANYRRRRLLVGLAAACLVFGLLAFSFFRLRLEANRSQSPYELADAPHLLGKVPTARVIEAGLSKPILPWAWQELERRPLTPPEADRIIDGVTSWVQREYPRGRQEPLAWLDRFLQYLDDRRLIKVDHKTRLLQAVHGDLRHEPVLRIREGTRKVDLRLECRYGWGDLLGFVMMNEVQSATVDGQPSELTFHYGRAWDRDELFLGLQLPELAPGSHKVRLQVLSALVAKEELAGLAQAAPSSEWPRGLERWVRTAEIDLVVHPRAAVIVSQTEDPALDPVKAGSLGIKQIIIRPKGDRAQAVVSLKPAEKLSVNLSFDVAIRIAGQTIPCGQIWVHKGADGRMRQTSGTELTAEIRPLTPEVQTADVIFTPNPERVESMPSVDRIWGGEIVFTEVSLTRQDLPATSATDSRR